MFQSYTKLIEYRTLPVNAPENRRLVQDLLAAVEVSETNGLGYLAFDLGDGNFLHIASVGSQVAKDSLHGLPSFQDWAKNLTQGLGISPKFTDVGVIGAAGLDTKIKAILNAQKTSEQI
jgi:hypothetical protein